MEKYILDPIPPKFHQFYDLDHPSMILLDEEIYRIKSDETFWIISLRFLRAILIITV